MSEVATTSITSISENLVTFIVLLVLIYASVTLFVYKSGIFDSLQKSSKAGIVQLVSVVAFGVLGYAFFNFGIS